MGLNGDENTFCSLEEKCYAINLIDSGMPAYTIAEQLGVVKTLIPNLRKSKDDLCLCVFL